jgi:hypothetical protein
MPQRPEAGQRLREIQAAFGRGLREGDTGTLASALQEFADVHVTDRMAVYRNNTRHNFRKALELTFPVLHRRVGDDFFRQLAHEYRAAHPSRSGDLHWVGRDFPAWLDVRLAGSDYAWLAELARLEWACEEASVAARHEPIGLEVLACIPGELLENVELLFQPCLRLVRSSYTVWSVWQANQGDDAGIPVDLAAGGECCVVACSEERVAVYRLDATDFALLELLVQGSPLGHAVSTSAADAAVLQRLLAWAFGEQLVVGLSPSAPA